jgi:hypothetical protein
MDFRIIGLSPEPFRPLFGLTDAQLHARGAKRYVADGAASYPDRIELRDARPGETVLLLNHVHQPADTPYHASHAVFVREGADAAFDAIGEVPPALRSRILSLRGFNDAHFIVDADLTEGREAEALIERLFADPDIAYIQAHYARHGCYAARIDRA